MTNEVCARCGDTDSGDHRTLWMACMYEMSELEIPLEQERLFCYPKDKVIFYERNERVTIKSYKAGGEVVEAPHVWHHKEPRSFDAENLNVKNFYTLRVCKDCRGSWMGAIKDWFGSHVPDISPGSGIFVRKNGATVEVSEEEWRQMHPDREPVRFRKEEPC